MRSMLIDAMPSFLVRIAASPYVSGNSIQKGIKKAESLWLKYGIYSTLDLLGEAVTSEEMVEYNIKVYTELITEAKDKPYISISIKPTAFGIHKSEEYCESSIRKVLKVAKDHQTEVTIDMEDHPYTDFTLRVYKKLLSDYPTLGTVLQSRLFRTGQDIEGLSGYKARIRICIGIYSEGPDIALQDKSEMKEKMIEYTQKLIEDGHFVEFATHDKKIINKILEIAQEKGWTHEHIEFQQLLGVPMLKTQMEINERGYVNRLYVPFATKWRYATPYLKRRLKNNPRMAWYVTKHMFKKLIGKR